MSNVILVTKDGFAAYCPDVLDHFVMRYDENGIYIGQEQENMIESNPPIVFIRPELIDGVPHVNGKPVEPLTEAEMSKAKGENQ